MMPASQSESQPHGNHWFAASGPERNYWDEAFSTGWTEWTVARHPSEEENIRSCQPGDWVIAYESVPREQVVGMGQIDNPPELFQKHGDPGAKVRIAMRGRFAAPIERPLVERAVPDLEHFQTGRPAFTRLSPSQAEALFALFANNPLQGGNPPPVQTPPAKLPGMPESFSQFSSLSCSALVREILDTCGRIAKDERYTRWISSGILLCACEQVGREALRKDDWSAARELARAIDANAFAKARAAYFEAQRRLKRGAVGGGGEYVSSHFTVVMREAMRLAGDVEVGARHLVVALLSVGEPDRPPTSWRLLYAAGADRYRLLRDLLDDLIERGYPEEREAWMVERRRLIQVSSVIAGYAADNPSGEDCLNLDGDILAMASLVAARAVEPPLAIGVFGAWGSGKSFFLHQLSAAIQKAAASNDSSFWSNIVQIEFNAWHYVDADLWASLTAHILKQLSTRIRQGAMAGPEEEEACPAALKLLQLADKQLERAAAREKQVKSELVAAEQKATAAITQIESDKAELATEVARSLIGEIDKDAVIAAVPGAKEALDDLSEIDAGFRQSATSAKDLKQRLESFGKTGGRLELLWTALLSGHGFWRKTLPWFVVAGGLIGFGWWLFGAEIQQYALAKLLGVLTPLATAIAGVARWVSSQHKRISKLLGPLEAVRKNIDAKIDAAEAERRQKIARLEASLEGKRADLRQATSEKAAAEKAVDDALQAARDTYSGKSIDAFIAQRVGSGEYQKHLGLIARIRDDFDTLSQMILTHNAIQSGRHDAKAVAVLRQKGVQIENLGINRIVLYIDDLDRCPSTRVVEVLQAIHLLLAFPVFVVIVAVDSRWMKRALADQYPLLVGGLGANGNGMHPGTQAPTPPDATPEDYLEKIFQIPYWLPPMSVVGAGKLLRSLAGIGEYDRREGRWSEDAKDLNQGPQSSKDQTIVQSSPPQGEPPAVSPAAPPQGASVESTENIPEPYREKLPTPTAERLELGRAESTAMEDLAMLIGRSPRAAKRFVNTYRVIRASLSEAQLEQIDRQRGYDAMMFLLALNTGASAAVVTGFEAKLRDLANSRVSVLETVREVATTVSTESMRPADREAALRVARWTSLPGKRWTSLTLELVRPWASRVRQFSFAGNDEILETPPRPSPAEPAAATPA